MSSVSCWNAVETATGINKDHPRRDFAVFLSDKGQGRGWNSRGRVGAGILEGRNWADSKCLYIV